ncbi:MAG: hypothetical protein A2W22_06870 [Candidatus Levybacteria bacterium RBG_16_35_11]|nr:MAG: hypothetical protein A2W22_06870 [Candidatus Levybacteria bacterium RBG_16_35_11]
MKTCLSKLKSVRGFTLIELLVVIGILGILAAALVATIDPFEQLKKADDSKIKNMVVEFQNANIRYYTTHTSFPWNDSNSAVAGCTGIGGADISGQPLSVAGLLACIGDEGVANTLIGEGELKPSFTSNENDLDRVFVEWSAAVGDENELTVCYAPTSKSQRASEETKYDVHGFEDGSGLSCPNQDGTCYWCTK